MPEIVINKNPVGFASIDWAVLDCYLPSMGVYGLAVYCLLVRHAGFVSRETCVSQPRMARMMGCSEKTVKRSLEDLEGLELILRRLGSTPGVTTVYEVLKPKPRPETAPFRQAIKSVEKKEIQPETPKEPEVQPPVVQSGVAGEPPTMATPTPDSGALPIRKNESVNNKVKTADLFEPAPGTSTEPSQWKTIIAEIDRLWEIGNPGVECEWVPLAFKRLKALLQSRPRWTTDQWLKCIRNRFSSDGINVGEAPEAFIPQLPKYIRSALNEYGKEAREGGPSGSRGDKNRAAVDQVVGELDDIIERSR